MGRQLSANPACPRIWSFPSRLRRDGSHGLREEAGLPFRMGLIRNHYVGRPSSNPSSAFATSASASSSTRPQPSRRQARRPHRRLHYPRDDKPQNCPHGPRRRRQGSSSPHQLSAHHFALLYGVDTPSKRDLIAANKSVEEIRRFIEADSLAYLSLEGLLKACDGGEHNGYCTACYTGNYPTQWAMWMRFCPRR